MSRQSVYVLPRAGNDQLHLWQLSSDPHSYFIILYFPATSKLANKGDRIEVDGCSCTNQHFHLFTTRFCLFICIFYHIFYLTGYSLLGL